MIFYFSGTGNSYAAALQLQEELGGELINIADCVRDRKYAFETSEEEPAGIVFPVYYGGLPSILHVFLSRLHFAKKPAYIYGVITCGSSIAAADQMLADRVASSGYHLDAVWSVKMRANYALLYEPTDEEAEKPILENAEKTVRRIADYVKEEVRQDIAPDIAMRALSAVMYPLYVHGRKTAPFHTDDQCVHCGICAGRCPERAIEMIDGKPTWVKERCVFCMSCVRCGAIQYGNKLTGRYRYKHPVYRKKKCH